MLIDCTFDNMTLNILIISQLLFIYFFQRSLIAISNNFIFYINDIRFAKIIIFTISNFSRIAVYKTRRYSSINENCKDHRFTYNITLHVMLKFSFYSIEDISRIIIWNSNHVILVNNNAIEMNFNDFLFEILHLFLIREFNFINMNSIDLRIYSLRIKFINVYDLNKKTRFYKYVNLRYVFDWCSFI